MIAYHNYYYRTNYYAFIHKMNNLTAYQLHYYSWQRMVEQLRFEMLVEDVVRNGRWIAAADQYEVI